MAASESEETERPAQVKTKRNRTSKTKEQSETKLTPPNAKTNRNEHSNANAKPTTHLVNSKPTTEPQAQSNQDQGHANAKRKANAPQRRRCDTSTYLINQTDNTNDNWRRPNMVTTSPKYDTDPKAA